MKKTLPVSYPDTYYSRTAQIAPARQSLCMEMDVDVCIVGAGIAGLSCAYELMTRDVKVAVLDSKRVAWGASGRNGGFVGPGYAGFGGLIKPGISPDIARRLFALSVEGMEVIRHNIHRAGIDCCVPTPGTLSVIRYNAPAQVQHYCAQMGAEHGYKLDYVSNTELRTQLNTDSYFQGYYDAQSFHLHPLNYCVGLANALEAGGGLIFENSEVLSMRLQDEKKITSTAQGKIISKNVVMCGGGYAGQVFGKIRRSLLPISTYVIVTEKLGCALGELIKTDAGIVDDRQASDYYRIVDNNRLLWGGRITARTTEPNRLAELLKKDMVSVFPQLREVNIDTAWSGLMAYARHRMPYIGLMQPGVWSCTAFGGHGLNTASIGGQLIAEAITGQTDRYKIFDTFKLQWNGGVFGPLAAQSVYAGLQLQDWWAETRS